MTAVESKGTTCPTPFTNMYTSVVLKIQASWTNNQGAKLICSNLEMCRIQFCVCLKSLSFRLPSHAVLYLMWRLQQQQGEILFHVVTAHWRRLLSRLSCQPCGVQGMAGGNLWVVPPGTWAEGSCAFKSAWQQGGCILKRAVVSATVLWWLSLVMAKSFRA